MDSRGALEATASASPWGSRAAMTKARLHRAGAGAFPVRGGRGPHGLLPWLPTHTSSTVMTQRLHLDDQVHEALVIITGDRCIGPDDQVSVNSSREVDVLACRTERGHSGPEIIPTGDPWVLSSHYPAPLPSIQSLAWPQLPQPPPTPPGDSPHVPASCLHAFTPPGATVRDPGTSHSHSNRLSLKGPPPPEAFPTLPGGNMKLPSL